MKIVIFGLSITSSWGNGHAVTYRALVRELVRRGHDVLFLERDMPWYAAHRDLPEPPYGHTILYDDPEDLYERRRASIAGADLLVVGSFLPDGITVARRALGLAAGATAFYDIDTPVTLDKLERGEAEYIDRSLVPCFDLYLSFTGGPTLEALEREFGAPRARHLPCSVDSEVYYPEDTSVRWDLGYLGTHSDDRQPKLERLLVRPARSWSDGRFIVAGPGYPADTRWPDNVERIEHLPPDRHRDFYNAQRYTLNVTRSAMVRRGWSPSVRLFEAAACGTPIITDRWDGLADYFEPGREVLVADDAREVYDILRELSDGERRALGRRARARVLREHTAAHRAASLERFAREVLGERRSEAVAVDGSSDRDGAVRPALGR